MQPANQDTVLGDFSDAGFEYSGVSYAFSERDGTFIIAADDSDGELREFEVSHTFGVYPLQQYLIPFPDGRYQALSVAWDSRPADEGGQRWFHLYPDETINYGDELHWTGRNQNWNYMCADCHSTDLKKGYDLAGKNYDTTWAEVTVGCEACHGPGSAHAESAESGASTGSIVSLGLQKEQIDTCAHCHSRRGVLAEGFSPGDEFLDHYRPSLLSEGLYHADGQIQDEVYVYGSFLQSKMHQRGVRCTDCHDPHSASLKRPGNDTCTFCHQATPPDQFTTLSPNLYDSPEHHFHEPGTEGAQCVNCHMVAQDYMVVDPRRDHSFRIPRPDLSASLGSPNACNTCHDDQTPEWAAGEIRKRFPDAKPAHYGEVIAAGRRRDRDADAALAELASDTSAAGIVRATALSLLAGYDTERADKAITAALRDDDPLVRLGALYGANPMDIGRLWQRAEHLLDDPVLVVRAEAALALAPAQAAGLRQADQQRLDAAASDYVATQMVNADTPEALTNLGGFFATVGDDQNAELAFQHALTTDGEWLPALVNLADFYRTRGRDDEGAVLLRRAISLVPDNAEARYAYGLLLTRRNEIEDALAQFEQAAVLRPGNARFTYVYGVALNSAGRSDDAVTVLEDGLLRFPTDADILFALVTMQRDRGNIESALEYAHRLQQLRPMDQNVRSLVQQLSGAGS